MMQLAQAFHSAETDIGYFPTSKPCSKTLSRNMCQSKRLPKATSTPGHTISFDSRNRGGWWQLEIEGGKELTAKQCSPTTEKEVHCFQLSTSKLCFKNAVLSFCAVYVCQAFPLNAPYANNNCNQTRDLKV